MADDREPDPGLFPAVYGELRRLAAARLVSEPAGHTLDATALVHEAYLRLRGGAGFAGRAEFLRAAAEAMRRILVDHTRRKRADKRGGAGKRFDVSERDRLVVSDPDTLLAVDEALARLEAEDPGSAALARLRLFAGLSVEELGLSRATAYRDWAYARAWLTAALSPERHR